MKKTILSLVLASMAGAAVAQNTASSLKDAYNDYFTIGVAVNKRNIAEAEQVALIKKEFNSITAENDMKPVSVHPREGV